MPRTGQGDQGGTLKRSLGVVSVSTSKLHFVPLEGATRRFLLNSRFADADNKAQNER